MVDEGKDLESVDMTAGMPDGAGNADGAPVEPDTATSPVPMSVTGRKCGLSIIAVVAVCLGVVSFVLAFIPRVSGFAPAVGCVGLVVAVLGIVSTLRKRWLGKTLSVVAVVLSMAGIVLSFVLPDNVTPPVEQTPVVSEEDSRADSDTENYGLQDLEGSTANSYVKIGQPVRSIPNVSGGDTVLVSYEWENHSGHDAAFANTVTAVVTQNGQTLEQALFAQNPEGYDTASQTASIGDGESATVTIAYTLVDGSPITVTVTDPASNDGGSTVEHVFDVF